MTNEDKDHLDQLLKNQTIELTRHVTAISENFDLKIGLIADGQVILRREMHEIRDELKQDITHLDFKIDTVNNHLSGRIDQLDSKIDSVEDSLSQKIDAIAIDIKAHRADTEAHGGIYRVKES
ncbi:hypothetical protein [Pelovirga terrestris]|uniref:hypothetical protein n=1 Tax=Pelovirga terrestris TaxID=2771352 RepID=UPI001CD04966|nr:hypothetical protein [Pelovirga terrestris]